MIDRTFNLTLAFLVLIGSTLAFGSDFLTARSNATQASAITVLPRVVITGSVEPTTLVAQRQSQAESTVQ